MNRGRSVLAALLLWGIAVTALALGIPKLNAPVNDYADMISPAAESRIGDLAIKLKQDTGAQVIVLTIESLQGEHVDEYAVRIFKTWGLGRADPDDGVLLLIAKNDRKTRLEVGYGLEPVLSDVLSRRILDQILRPNFRAGDVDGGVERAVEAIDGLIRGTSTLPPPSSSDSQADLPPRLFGVMWLLFLIPFVLVVVGTNPFQWFLYLFLIPFVGVGGVTAINPEGGPFLVVLWLIAAPIVWSFFGRRKKKQKRGRRRSGWSGGGWSSGGSWSSGGGGGWSSGGGGGWSSGGGGFSGGGGSSGGGGASSSW